MKKRLMALLLATTVIASGCGAEDEPDEKDVEVSGSEEKSDEDSEDDNSVSDSDTEVSDDGIKFEGRYTEGGETWAFCGDEATCYDAKFRVEFTVNFKIDGNELILDMDTIELTDAFMDYYEDNSSEFSYSVDQLIKNSKTMWGDICKFEYDKKDDTLTFRKDKFIVTFYNAENYVLGPNGVYTCEDNDNITITFEDGEVTFDNDGNKETFLYNCYQEVENIGISFYGVDFWGSEFYNTCHFSSMLAANFDEIDFFNNPNGTFKK